MKLSGLLAVHVNTSYRLSPPQSRIPSLLCVPVFVFAFVFALAFAFSFPFGC